MIRRIGFALCAFLCSLAPVCAQDLSNLAPADAYFGRFNMSILGIANTIRDAGLRMNASNDPAPVLNGPLAFASDAIHAWEAKYPRDPWIAKDLLALEIVYLHAPGNEALRLAGKTEAWLGRDYPRTAYASTGRRALRGSVVDDDQVSEESPRTSPWERFAALRVQVESAR